MQRKKLTRSCGIYILATTTIYVKTSLCVFNFDESFWNIIKFGDNSTISIMKKGNVKIKTNKGFDQIISNVFFIPILKINLVSVGQLQEKGYEITIKDGTCRIQDPKRGLIA